MKLKLLPSTILAPPSFARSLSHSSSKHRVNFIVASKKKKHNKHNNNDSQGSTPPPPRITSNAKQNLQFIKAWKESQNRKSTTPRTSTSYRKKKAQKKDIDLDHDPPSSLHHTDKFKIEDYPVPVMLVDGYNVCGHWMKLKKHFMNGRLELARHLLIDELRTFSVLGEYKVVVVFDAMMSGFPNHKEYAYGIDIVFSSKTSADTWIEKQVSVLKKDGCLDVLVVTSDRSQQEAANGAGAFVWSCKALISEINEAQKEIDEMLQEQSSTYFRGMLLKHNLDTKVVDALRKLRQKLCEEEIARLRSL